jgi:hypothetical protein
VALNYAMVRDGKVIVRKTLCDVSGNQSRRSGFAGRFQLTPNGRLFVFYYANGAGNSARSPGENRVLEIEASGVKVGLDIQVPMKRPLSSFFTATIRAGSPASEAIDLLGPRAGSRNAISYARVRLW